MHCCATQFKGVHRGEGFGAEPSSGGAEAGVLSYQDSLKHIHVSLDTRLPASYGPGKTIPPPQLQPNISASIRNHYPMLSHRAEGAWYLTSGPWSDMDVAIERHMDVLERVLK